MKLPVFEVPEFEQRNSLPVSTERGVDDLHSLESNREWKQDDSTVLESATNAVQKSNGWNTNLADKNDGHLQPGIGSTSTHIHQISQKFREVLQLKNREAMQDKMDSDNSAMLNSPDNSSPQVFSSLVRAVLGDRQQEETRALVEHMLKRVMEEFERQILTQRDQVMNLKKTLKEQLMHENKFALRARVLETLAAGTGEELKILSSQLQKMRMEKKRAEDDNKVKEVLVARLLKEREELQTTLGAVKKDIDRVKLRDREEYQRLEQQKKELQQEMLAKLRESEVLLKESKKREQELRSSSSDEKQLLRKRDDQYRFFIPSQLHSLQGIKSVLQGTKRQVLHMQDAWQEELAALELQLQGLAHAALSYHNVLAENRQLYNEVQDLKGNIRVYCRVRPFLPGQDATQSSVEFVGEDGDILISSPSKQGKDFRKMFNFNKVFGASATQEEVFLDTRPLIRSVLDGYNVCIFAYGQTGSGKTYTMSGPISASQKDWGVNYRALRDLFQLSQRREDVFKYEVGVQMIEIYNEQVRDLLFIDGSNRRLEIRNNSQLNGLNVPDASMLPVNSASDVFELMKIGQKNRAVGATALNEHSSRSHSVLTVHVQGTDLASGSLLRGCLHLVDLAGSERVYRSEATGDRLKEAQHINKSLSALGDVVSALAQKSAHVPYRNSKLTQLLQDSLGGQAKTLMFVHISPDIESFGETISTLKFAERVASVELGAARSNKESREAHDLKEQIAMLKEVILKKDAEIERLQMVQISRNEKITGFENAKSKLSSGILFRKPIVKLHQQKLRRQTVDVAEQKEKRTTGRLFQDTQLQASETVSPPESPRALKELLPITGKMVPAHLVAVQNRGRNSTSENRIEDIASGRCINQKGDHDYGAESEDLPREWWHGSSTDSSLFGTSSLDDVPFALDGTLAGKTVAQPLRPNSVATFPGLGTVVDGERNVQVMKVHESQMQDSHERLSESALEPYTSDTMQNKFQVGIDRMQNKELDTASEVSEGDISQAESEASLSRMVKQAASIGEKNNKSVKTMRGEREPRLSHIPRPSSSECTHARRHSTAVSLALGLKCSSSRSPHHLGTKFVDDSLNSFKYKDEK